MGDTATQVILAVQARHYSFIHSWGWDISKKFIEEIESRLLDAPVVCWTQTKIINPFAIPSSEFNWGKVMHYNYWNRYEHDAEDMLEVVGKVVKENGIQTFELILFMDVVDCGYNWESFRDKLRTSTFYNHISQVTMYFPSIELKIMPMAMPTEFLRAFHGLPVKVHFHDLVVEIEKEIQIPSLNLEPSCSDYHSFLDSLGQYIFLNSTTKSERDVFIQTLKDVEKKYIDDISREKCPYLKPFGDHSSYESIVRGFVETESWAMLKKFYDETLRRQLLIFAQHKFRRLYDLLEKPIISFNDYLCFIPSLLYRYNVRDTLGIVNQEEEANMKDDTPDPQMDQKRGADAYLFSDSIFFKATYNTECDECPFLLLEYFNLDLLNSKFRVCMKNNDEHQNMNITLYNIDHPDSKLLTPRTKVDDVIVEGIRLYTDIRYGPRRNRGLVAIVFLFALYLTDKVQNDEFVKKCVGYTIMRLSLVYKCNLTIFKSEHPHIYVRIYDALMYAVHVSCMEPDPSKNFYKRLRAAGPYFVFLMESIFQTKFPQPINVRCWLALDYLIKISKRSEKSIEAVAMTKVVDWIHTTNGNLLIRGKESDKCYHELLDGLSFNDIFKLKKLIDDNADLYAKKFEFSLANMDIEVTVPSVKYDTPLVEEVHYKHVKICESTCRPTINCQETGISWKECFPKEQRKPHLSFFNLFGKYCQLYRKYPTDTDMMAYLIMSFPLETFYRNTETILRHITEEFKQMNIEMDIFLERFTRSKTFEKRIKSEADCKCSAHTPIRVECSVLDK